MMCAFASSGLSRVAEATLVKPTLQGAVVSWYGLVAVGLSAATLSSLGCTESFLCPPHRKGETERYQTPSSLGPQQTPSLPRFIKTLLRCFVVPAYVEEAIWRCFIHPRPTAIVTAVERTALSANSLATIIQILVINTAFALYHPLVGTIVWKYLPTKFDVPSLRRPGVSRIFSDPAFLILTFVLGSVCSAAYMLSGGGLYAPVFIHGVAVAVWLELLGGAQLLRIYSHAKDGD